MKKRYLGISWALLTAALVGALSLHGPELLDFAQAQYAQLEQLYASNPSLVMTAYFIVMITVVSLMLPLSLIMMLIGGALFDWPTALALSVIATTIGSVNIFLLARYTLHEWVHTRYKAKVMHVDEAMAENGAFYLLILRLSPGIPTYLIAVLMGVTTMPLKVFTWVTLMGIVPWTAVYVAAGATFTQLNSLSDIVTPDIMMVFGGMALLMGGAVWVKQCHSDWFRGAIRAS